MNPHLKHLIDLQAVDLRLIEINDRLSRFPKRLAEVEARAAGARQHVADAKNALTTSVKERRTFEMDVEQWKERAKKYRGQSAEVKTNEAYKALLHEIANAEDEAGKAEDRLLDRMVAGEQYERDLKSAEAAVKEAESAADHDRKAIQAEYNAVQKELSAAEAARAKAVAAVPEDLVDHYQRIAKRHNGIALSEIHGEGCGQCGVHIRPHVIQQLQRPENQEFFHCETCTRILYYSDGPSPALGQSQQAAAPATAEPSTAPAREN